jgi:hypothetical protein
MVTTDPLNMVLILPDSVQVKIPNTDFDETNVTFFERPRTRLHCTRLLLFTAQKYIV